MRKNKSKNKSLLFSKWFIGTIGIIFILLSASLIKEFFRSHKINQEINNLRAEISDLEEKNEDYAEFVEFLKTDLYFEEQARIKLGLKVPGEKVIVLSDNEDAETTTVQKENSFLSGITGNLTEGKNTEKWIDYFFGA